MKSKFSLIIASNIFIVLAAVQAAILLFAGLLELLAPAPRIAPNPNTWTIYEAPKWENFIWASAPYLLLIFLGGLGFVLRKMTKRLE